MSICQLLNGGQRGVKTKIYRRSVFSSTRSFEREKAESIRGSLTGFRVDDTCQCERKAYSVDTYDVK